MVAYLCKIYLARFFAGAAPSVLSFVGLAVSFVGFISHCAAMLKLTGFFFKPLPIVAEGIIFLGCTFPLHPRSRRHILGKSPKWIFVKLGQRILHAPIRSKVTDVNLHEMAF